MMEIQVQSGLFEQQRFYVEIKDEKIYMSNEYLQKVVPLQDIEGIQSYAQGNQNIFLQITTPDEIIEGNCVANQDSQEFIKQLLQFS